MPWLPRSPSLARDPGATITGPGGRGLRNRTPRSPTLSDRHRAGLNLAGPRRGAGPGEEDACRCHGRRLGPAPQGEGPSRRPGANTGARTPPLRPPGVSEGDGPVLKHGPRSAACMQGDGTSIPKNRNESNHMGPTLGIRARSGGPPPRGSTPPGRTWDTSPGERRGVVCAPPPES
jgi:hypothetical protein